MKTLIADDDFTSRLLLQGILRIYGPCQVAVNGKEAVQAVRTALETEQPYDLICLDIMMPELDGQMALKSIRDEEETWGIVPAKRAKIIMTTALSDGKNIIDAYSGLCDSYLMKPLDKAKLLDELRKLKLIKSM